MNTPSLASLQQQFRDALHYQAYELPVADGATDAESLLQVYRNNFVMTLTECLENIYPVVNALVGDECFQAVARHHVLNNAMDDACADQYGAGFSDTLRALPNIVESAPYLADIADVEWHIQCVNRASLPSVFPVDALSQVSADDFHNIKLSVAAASRAGHSQFAVVSLWQAVTHHDEHALSQLHIDQPESYLVQKNKEGISVITLGDDEASLIIACKTSKVGDIAPDLLPLLPNAMQRGVFEDFALAND